MRELAKDSAYQEQIDEEYIDNLYKAAPLHDIGKIKIPDAILQKPGKLTTEEFDVMKTHTTEGGRIIDQTIGKIEEGSYIDTAHDVAKYHHEKWDGNGYPEGLSGNEIPLSARVMAVADVFEALISERCYKKAFSLDKAYEIIQEGRGTQFDPVIVDVFVRLRPEVEKYLKKS
ncbi:MAG: HD domain-containing protein [Butyribacter sp.]|nr:HD domain-containing protein [Butyribacter sp.]